MTIFKTKKTRLFFRYFWSWYIHWLPTIQTSYHPKDESVLSNFDVGDTKSYKGSELEFNILWLIFTFNFSFWWNIEVKTYSR